jgi:C-1 hydroxylase
MTVSTGEENKAVVQRIFDAVLSGGDFSVSDSYVAPDAKFYTHARPEPFIGPQGFREYIGSVRAGIPDTQIEVHDTVAEGDTVMASWTLHGTHTEKLMGVPPLGNTVALDALELIRFRDGKIVEIRLMMDGINLMRQLGVMPAQTKPGLPPPLLAMVYAKRFTRRVKRFLKR